MWGPERRVRASGGRTGRLVEGSEVRRDGRGNVIVPQDLIVQDEVSFLRGRVRALEGAVELLNRALFSDESIEGI